MTSALLNRAIRGLRSVQPPLSLAQTSRSYTSISKRTPSYRRAGFSPLFSPPKPYLFVRCCSGSASSAATMTTSAIELISRSEPVVSCDWLRANLRDPDVKVLDASWYMPDEQRNPFQEYQAENGKAQAANAPQISKFGSILNPPITNDVIVHLSNHYATLLEACNGPTDLPKGRQIHAQIITSGHNSIFSARILDMYVLCQSLFDAKDVFFRVDRRSSSWNRMIMGFNTMGLFDFALLFYFKMRVADILPDKYTFTHVIKSCRGLSAVTLGRLIHSTIRSIGLEQDPFVGSSLIMMYAGSDCIGDAREVFDRMPEKDCVLWNVMIDGYKRIGDKGNAIGLFDRMRTEGARPNLVSFTTVLSIYAAEAMLSYGMQLRGMTIKCGVDLDVSVANTLLALYSKCRCSSDVNMLFSTMLQNDLVAWNGMISGCVQNGLKEEALDFFTKCKVLVLNLILSH